MQDWHIISDIEISEQFNIVLLFGVIFLGGTFASRLFQKMKIPQVVGCIFVGILFGDILGIIRPATIEMLEPFTMIALGLIGFMIGGELRGDVFKKYGHQFFTILFSQGLGAFLLVAVSTSFVAWIISKDVRSAIAMGLILGAIGSATAPAATVNVLWEFKTRGPLTAAILAVVALDDGLALLLYRAASSAAQTFTGHESHVWRSIFLVLGEIVGAVFLGFIVGVGLYYLLKFVRGDDKILTFTIASLFIVVGISIIPGIDPILPAMTLGITVANMLPRQSKYIFELVKHFSPPVYISFFVLAGAHMELGKIGGMMIVMIVVYTIFRAFGKVIGSWFGAKHSGSAITVQKYLGICLLPQAGVAIGLAILAGKQFEGEVGNTIIMVVMTATFLMEILGPMLVKVGIEKAGEVGMNVTEDDLIKSYLVKDVMDGAPLHIAEDTLLGEILEIFSKTDSVYYPVVDAEHNAIGKITIAGIKEMFANQDVCGWLLAVDVAEPLVDVVTEETALADAFEKMKKYDMENISVLQSGESRKLVGVLDIRGANRKINAEVLRRRQKADEMSLAIS
jgi:Kef-type K+ transport system membrane component KefB